MPFDVGAEPEPAGVRTSVKNWQEASGKDQKWYEAALGDDNPLIIYIHGKGGMLLQTLHEGYMRKYYKHLPGFEWFFVDTLTENNIIFHNAGNLMSISTPVLILHAEDDNVIPFELGRKGVCHDDLQIKELSWVMAQINFVRIDWLLH